MLSMPAPTGWLEKPLARTPAQVPLDTPASSRKKARHELDVPTGTSVLLEARGESAAAGPVLPSDGQSGRGGRVSQGLPSAGSTTPMTRSHQVATRASAPTAVKKSENGAQPSRATRRPVSREQQVEGRTGAADEAAAIAVEGVHQLDVEMRPRMMQGLRRSSACIDLDGTVAGGPRSANNMFGGPLLAPADSFAISQSTLSRPPPEAAIPPLAPAPRQWRLRRDWEPVT